MLIHLLQLGQHACVLASQEACLHLNNKSVPLFEKLKYKSSSLSMDLYRCCLLLYHIFLNLKRNNIQIIIYSYENVLTCLIYSLIFSHIVQIFRIARVDKLVS